MKICRYIFTAIFFIIVSGTLYAQPAGYIHETFGSRNGLLSPKIYSLTQSHDHVLWIGSELGLSSYDGYSFTNYQYTTSNETTGRILCITQDSSGMVWAGGDKGLFMIRNGTIEKLQISNKVNISIEALLTDAAGNIWAGDINGLYLLTAYDLKKIKASTTPSTSFEPYGGFKKRVFALASDAQQNIYVGGFDALFRFKKSDKRYEILWDSPTPQEYIRSVSVTSRGDVYWNLINGDAYTQHNGQVSRNNYTDFLVWKHFSSGSKTVVFTSDNIVAVSTDAKEILNFTGMTNHLHDGLIDVEGNYWLGTWEGLHKFSKKTFQQYRSINTAPPEIFSFLETKDHHLLFGGNHGNVYTNENDQLVPDKTKPAFFPAAEIMCMNQTKDGSIWAGSGYQYLARFKNNRLQSFTPNSFLKDNNCEELYQTPDGKLFAATENGVTIIDPMAESPCVAHVSFKDTYSRFPELFGCFSPAKDLYVFYGSRGLYKMKGNYLQEVMIKGVAVKDLYVNKVIVDKYGFCWIATQGKGLLCCRFDGNELSLIKVYDSYHGLPSDNSLAVIMDNNKNIWVADFTGVSVIMQPGKNEHIVSYNEYDGLLSTYYQTLKFGIASTGKIWALTSMGVYSFHPDSLEQNNIKPAVFFDSIMINEKRLPVTVNTITEPVSLSHSDNTIEFNYTAVCLTTPSKIRYAYRLKGVNENWTVTKDRKITWHSLPPGDYVFELKACNNNNVWTTDIVSFTFHISPPFWQTWWFVLICLLLAALIVYLAVKKRIRAIKDKAAVHQQLAELEGKALRAQMNPHFIFNSLNAIQECIILENIDAAYAYLSKFSRLLRMVLNNSEKNLVPLHDEMEMIRLYLELESLRFKQSFSYSIGIDEKIEEDAVMVPPLLLQPYIENAIWHGLMHKEGGKKLLINIRRTDHGLQCIIEDNGIGRQRSAAIKAAKIGATHFESKGMELSRQRMQMMNLQQEKFTLDIEDLYDENRNATGTRITISLINY